MINIYKTTLMKKYLEKDESNNPNFHKHNLKINCHYWVAGGSGTGKTNCIASLISQFYDTFNHIYIYLQNNPMNLYIKCYNPN